MATPEQKFRERWRATLPQGSFLQLIETRESGVPDAFVLIPVKGSNSEHLSTRAMWIEFKVPPYQLDDVQINWHIRYIRAGGQSGIIAPLPVQKPTKTTPNLCPTAALDRPTRALSTLTHTKAPTNKLKPSDGPLCGSLDVSVRPLKASAMPEIGFWDMTGWPPEEIEKINTYIKSGHRGIEWKIWLKEVGLSEAD
jgi:hypothetical protein